MIEKMFNQTKLPFESECNVLHKNVNEHNLTTNPSTDRYKINLPEMMEFNEVSFHLFYWLQFTFIIVFILLLSLR